MSSYPYGYRRRTPLSRAAGPVAVGVLAAVLARGVHLPATTPGGAPGGSRLAGYVNPLAGGRWSPARTDQGVDYMPAGPQPVRAIGDGTVIYSSTATGWPGGGFISYRLTSGPAAGHVVFVAEHLSSLTPAGTTVRAGERIATAWPGYPWTEWGWGCSSGDLPAVQYNGAPDGTPMPGGKAFARLMRGLGAATLQDPGPGPDTVRAC